MSEEKNLSAGEEQPLSAAEIDKKMKALELKIKELELQDAEERLAERRLAREARSEKARNNGQTMKQNDQKEAAHQASCTHRKGGNGLPDFLGGRGQDPQYAVIKHIMLNGDTWVRCQRCGKTWKPPVRKNFYFDANGKQTFNPNKGTFDQAKYDAKLVEWKEAVNFQTKNITSSSYMFKYSDGGEYSREVLEHTTLR